MPTLTALARRARLAAPDVRWLHALVSDWQLLADLSFADLTLWAELPDGGWLALSQMRPTTGPTAFPDDIVGTARPAGERPFLDAAKRDRRICREGDPEWTRGVPVRHETIPVVSGDRVIAVIERSTNLSSARTPSRLDIAYLKAADDLAQMVATGLFPCPGEEPALVRSPRVGDGLLRLNRSGKVTYASPNALSAYRRLGLTADLAGKELGLLTARLISVSGQPHDDSLMLTASGKAHMETEIEANGSVVQLRTIPLVVNGGRSGALILVRDVTELRDRERELLTKDATIREIHHRVKNNLQTVAALLRLQARRLSAPEARAALEEAVRRVGSIAIVHETLSHAPEEVVDFDDIAGRVAMMAGEVSAPEARVTPRPERLIRDAAGGHRDAAGAGAHRAPAERAAARADQARSRDAGGDSRPRRAPARAAARAGRDAAGHGPARGQQADRDGGRQRGRAAGRIRPGATRPAWACRSSARWWSRN